MYRHFCLRHPQATIVIEGDGELPSCTRCGYFTPDIEKHQRTEICRKGQRRRENERKQREQDASENVRFEVDGKAIERVKAFTYLGRTLSEDDNDTKCITDRIAKARAKWWRIAKILKSEGANAKIMAKFYKAVIQAVLLYGAESWVLTKENLRKLNSFHLRAIRHMTGEHIRKRGDSTWEYPKHEELLTKCDLEEMTGYIERRRTTLRNYLQKNKRDLLHEAAQTRNPARHVTKILWWNQ